MSVPTAINNRLLELLDHKALEAGSGIPAQTATGVTPPWPARTAAVATYGLAQGAWDWSQGAWSPQHAVGAPLTPSAAAGPAPASSSAAAACRDAGPEVPVDVQVENVAGVDVAVATLQQTAAAMASGRRASRRHCMCLIHSTRPAISL